MCCVATIESCVFFDEYRNLVLSVASIVIFVLSVTSLVSCILHGEYSGDNRNLVLSMTSINILCSLWRV